MFMQRMPYLFKKKLDFLLNLAAILHDSSENEQKIRKKTKVFQEQKM